MLVLREKTVNNCIGEFIGPFPVMHHYKRSKTVTIDQDGVIKRYSRSQIRPFLEQPSMLDDSIAQRKIEDWHDKMYRETDESEIDGDNVQLNVDEQSYEEQLITDDRVQYHQELRPINHKGT